MSEFSNLCCFHVEKDDDVSRTRQIINSIIKEETDNDVITLLTIPILPLMVEPCFVPPLQKPLKGTIDSCVKGLSKNQDIVRTGKKSEEYFWIVCCDGHGNNTFVDILKALDWREIMEHPNSYYYMQSKLSRCYYSINSGSTLCMVKIFEDKIECISIGDSRVFIYKNEEMAYTNTPHIYSNEAERLRLSSSETVKMSNVRYEMFPAISSETSMKQKKLSYVTFLQKHTNNTNNSVTLAMTQSIGHYNITGFAPEFKTVEYDSHMDKIRVIVGTDGFFDMCLVESTGISAEEEAGRKKDKQYLLQLSAEELADKAEKRWRQQWKYYYGGQKFPNLFDETAFDKSSIDDIGIAIWSSS
jgi:serine/threonine protein phosphatase PrpC